jgi:large subunit ribosomal protein L10
LDRAQKSAVIDEVTTQIQESEAVFAVDYRGISVPQAAELRTKLREADATFRVTKNTLTERAADNADAPALKDFLQGPTAMTFVRGDAAAAAKALADFSRTSGLLTFKGGWMNGAPLTADQIVAISRLPSREVLYGRLVGMVASPLTGLAAGMSNLISGLGRQLAQIAEQGLIGGDAPAPAPESDSAPADGPAAEAATDEVVEAADETTAATDDAPASE